MLRIGWFSKQDAGTSERKNLNRTSPGSGGCTMPVTDQIKAYGSISEYCRRLNPSCWLELMGYHLYSVWLFTYSDIKTIIGPSTMFGIVTGLASCSFGIEHEVSNPTDWVLRSLPRTLLWTWINLLPFTIDNQRQTLAIEEDSTNKPWRTLPSGRMTPAQAKVLMYCLYPAALCVALRNGGTKQSIALIFLGYWYNHLEGADMSFVIRNLINACGFVCFTSGALEVSLGQQLYSSPRLLGWLGTIFVTVFLTVQTQDMYDQAGDWVRGRKTVPLELGDGLARWTIAVPMAVLSYWCPRWWSLPPIGFVIPVTLGMSVAWRTLRRRSIQDDKRTFQIWNMWMFTLYTLPGMKILL